MELNSTMRLTRLSELGNGVTLYGLQYPGFHGCVSWCYVTIGPAVIVISQPERGDCGTSITNIWGEYFIRSLENMPEIAAAGHDLHWFEQYYGNEDPEMDEVFLTREGRASWKLGAKGLVALAAAFEHLTGEPGGRRTDRGARK